LSLAALAPVSLFGASLEIPPSSASSNLPSSPSAVNAGEALAALPGSAVGASHGPPAPFADILTEAVGQVQQLEAQAGTAIEGLISGKGVDVHEAMIAAQKAGMGFELTLSVRNKALAAYQQVIGMQF
jgi:flagellar hook-basal body complex protein FliE